MTSGARHWLTKRDLSKYLFKQKKQGLTAYTHSSIDRPPFRFMSSTSSSMNPDQVITKIRDLVAKEKLLVGEFDSKRKVVEFEHPKDLERIMSLAIGQEGISEEQFDEICEQTVRYSVKTTHPMFFNQLYHGVDPVGLAGSWLSDALNTNNHTFECAPVFILTERAVLRWIMSKFGWTDGDGIFCPGGSLANMYGMMLARHQRFPELKQTGLAGTKPLVAFTSEESHYSVVKGANWLGIGTENCVKVKTNAKGEMIPEELEREIKAAAAAGKLPYFVNATAGSTVMGAFDDLEAISAVCRRHDVWLHVDACWGGAVCVSPKLKYMIRGSELVDSLSWNPHKMLGAPLQTSPFITRHKNLLHKCNSASATYLFQTDKFYDVSYDTGDMSVQCGRKVDGFKFWFMLKTRGERHFADLVDNAFAQAHYLADLVRKTPGFRMVFDEVSCTNVCFEYIPERLRGKTEDEAWQLEMAKVPPKVKEGMIKEGTMMIGYQPLPHKNKKNFFRMVVHCNPPPTNKDIEYIISEIDRLGKNL